MIGITGWNTTIAQEFRRRILWPIEPDSLGKITDTAERLDWSHNCPVVEISKCDRVLVAHGALSSDTSAVYHSNLSSVYELCEAALRNVDNMRICVIGSESGISGSYDIEYSLAKAALHKYVETRRVKPNQQLVCVAPTVIEDSGMTERRDDQDNVKRKREAHPKGRFLNAREVAAMAYHLLYVDEGYTTNCVIRMNGGAHTV